MATKEQVLIRTDSPAGWQVEVFFDGACPLCRREINMIRRRDCAGRIRFIDIAAADFRAGDYGVSFDRLMAEIHGRLPDGTWIRGVEVFRRLYSAIGWGAAVWLTRLPGISGLLDFGYRVFARNRLRWTGRCSPDTGSCRRSTPAVDFISGNSEGRSASCSSPVWHKT